MYQIYDWSDVFASENIDGKSDVELCAIGLSGWGNVIAGAEQPESFGRVMAKIGSKLRMQGRASDFERWYEKFARQQ